MNKKEFTFEERTIAVDIQNMKSHVRYYKKRAAYMDDVIKEYEKKLDDSLQKRGVIRKKCDD
jgi:hypothetical protein